jgi:hypothetical protein
VNLFHRIAALLFPVETSYIDDGTGHRVAVMSTSFGGTSLNAEDLAKSKQVQDLLTADLTLTNS